MYFNCMFVSNTKRGWAYISRVEFAYLHTGPEFESEHSKRRGMNSTKYLQVLILFLSF